MEKDIRAVAKVNRSFCDLWKLNLSCLMYSVLSDPREGLDAKVLLTRPNIDLRFNSWQ